MSGNANVGFAKDPLLPSHGDSLPDQSFQSLKSREVRDSSIPAHDLKFHSSALSQPSTTGWDVRSSSEVSPDGRAYRTETVATTDGTEKLNGGVAEFKGRNEQRSSASHQGDDKNFVKKAADSSNTHLQEKVVIGDEHSGRTEIKKSSTTTSSSSQVFSSSTSTTNDNDLLEQPQQYRQITDGSHQLNQQRQFENEQRNIRQHEEQQQYRQQQQVNSTNQQQSTHQEQRNETYNQSRQNTSQNVETERHYEENKHYVDMDKASPEYQRHVQHLMAQPGEIISSTVEYPKPNVKMITTVKRLPDGTVVKNKRYETEELTPASERIQQRSSTTSSNATNTTTNQQRQTTQQQRVEEENLQTRLKNSRERNVTNTYQASPQRLSVDAVDNAQTRSFTQDHQQQQSTKSQNTHDVNSETTFSTVQKSSRHFSTESATEKVEEINEHSGTPTRREKPQDFSTHGFPSVKPHKPTQEYPSDRPSPVRTTAADELVTTRQRDVSDLQAQPGHTNVRTIKTADGDVIIVSKETQRSVKQKSSAERIIETEIVSDIDGGAQPQRMIQKTQQHETTQDFHKTNQPRHGTPFDEQPHQAPRREDFTTHGFPSVKENSPVWDDRTHQQPTARDHTSPAKHVQPYTNAEQEQVTKTFSTETRHSSKHATNAERIIEVVNESDHQHHYHVDHHHHHPTEDFSTHGFPSVRDVKKTRDISPVHTTPVRERTTSPHGYPSARSPRERTTSPHGYPSSRSPTRSKPDYSSSHGFPAARSPTRSQPLTQSKPKTRTQSPQRKVVTTTTSTSSPRKPSSSTTTTDSRSLSKQQDVDATHRRFAASLRSSSPVDHHQRRDSHDSHHSQQPRQKSTPRSSISSQATTRTFRRDQREGSHESGAPSESSRISSSTVTHRQSPGKTVGKTVVTTTKQTVVKTRNNNNGSNDTIDLTPQRSTVKTSKPQTTTKTTTITTKSPLPGKSVTTTTTTTSTSSKQHAAPKTPTTPTKSAPASPIKSTPTSPIKTTPAPISKPNTATPQTDNQLTKPTTADEQIPINHEPLTITKTKFSSNDATASQQNEAIIEEPICRKKHFYQLGPSDEIPTAPTTTSTETTTNITTNTLIPKDAYDEPQVQAIIESKVEAPVATATSISKNLTAEESDILTKIFDKATASTETAATELKTVEQPVMVPTLATPQKTSNEKKTNSKSNKKHKKQKKSKTDVNSSSATTKSHETSTESSKAAATNKRTAIEA